LRDSLGNAELQSESLFQVFWYLTNLSLIAALNFIVNLHHAGEQSRVATFYDFLSLDSVEIIKHTLPFNATIGAIIISGSISIVLYFLQIRTILSAMNSDPLT
jgi:hypothetical protein